MGASLSDEFAEAARNVDAAVSRIAAADVTARLTDVVDAPAFGTALPFEGVSYDGTPVDPSPTSADLTTAATGVTAGSLGIADYGSVVLHETGDGEELLGLYPELHVVVVAESDIVPDMPSAYAELESAVADGLDDAIIATGPSATADMGAVVTGVHGPRDVHIVVLEDR